MIAFLKFAKSYREPFNGLNILENFLISQGWAYKFPADKGRYWSKGECQNTLEWALSVEGVSIEAWESIKEAIESSFFMLCSIKN
jgi:hypothetical protein